MGADGKPLKGKNGRPILDWHKASVEDAAAALVETTGGDKVMARDTATDLVKNEQARLKKVQKQVAVNRLFLVTKWLEEHKE